MTQQKEYTTPDPIELALTESHFDSVAHDFLTYLNDAEVLDAYYEFRKILHNSIQQKFPTIIFANF